LAAIFGVERSTLTRAIKGETWNGAATVDVSAVLEAKRYGKGMFRGGNSNGRAKLTEAQVVEIVELYKASNKSVSEIAEQYGVSRTVVGKILSGELWTHVDADLPGQGRRSSGDRHWTRRNPEQRRMGTASGNAKLTEEIVREMRTRYAAGGVTQQALSDEYGINRGTISEIINRKLWKHVE
jgi:DNA invertase Pin-like site-specific DNA recombinase